MRCTCIAIMLLACLGISAADNKFELITGLRSGSGYSLVSIVYPNGTFTDTNNTYIATGKYIQDQPGFYIPAKAEILFGVKGFRIGYMFGYTFSKYSSNTLRFKPETPKIPTTTGSSNLLLHSLTHLVKMEYNWPVRIKTAKLLIGATAGIGGYHGWLNNKKYGIKTDFSIYKNKIIILAGINLEVVKGPFSLVLSPVYIYQDFQPKRTFFGTIGLHNVGLDIGFRLNLLKPKKAQP